MCIAIELEMAMADFIVFEIFPISDLTSDTKWDLP